MSRSTGVSQEYKTVSTKPSINGFRGDFRFLSNFWPAEIVVCGLTFPSTEHAYQALKSPHREIWHEVKSMRRAADAKRLGKEIEVRPNWHRLKVPTMRLLLRRKFTIPDLRKALLLTNDHYLEETNHWGDTFWGVCNGIGENHLGHLLMQVRKELQDAHA